MHHHHAASQRVIESIVGNMDQFQQKQPASAGCFCVGFSSLQLSVRQGILDTEGKEGSQTEVQYFLARLEPEDQNIAGLH